ANAKTDTLAVDGTKSSDPIKMQMTGLSMDVDSRMGKFGLSVGDSAIKIKRIDVTKPDVDVKVALDNFGYTVKLSEDDKNINIQAAYQTGELNVNDVALGNGQAVIKLARLDGAAVKQLSDTYNQLMRQYMADTR
ncbi:YdgA family protein, partial [Campylobacter lari]|nr:YdgA family protein [Campylobacter lari]